MTVTTYDDWPAPPVELGQYDEAKAAAAVRFAQGLLWAKLGRRHGLARTYGELYRAESSDRCGLAPWTPVLHDGEWYNVRGAHTCCAIQLEHQPVRAVVEVRFDGAPMTGFTLEGNLLRRNDACWPCWTPELPRAIEVDYTWGGALPAGVEVAHAELTGEVLAAMTGQPCRLPSNVSSIVRQGVSYDFGDPSVFRSEGLLGLELCDALIDQVNPSRLKYRSRVFSPDLGRRVG